MQFLMRFWKHFGFNCLEPKLSIFEVGWDSFLDSAESGAPHENNVNSNEIEARALGKATNKNPTTEENCTKTKTNIRLLF